MDAKRAQRLEVILRYSAGVIFAVLALSGFQTSASTAAMQDLGTSLYHDPVDVSVLWFQSQACMVVPPDNYVTNCTTLPSIGGTLALTVLLAVVLVAYMVVRKRSKVTQNPHTASRL